MTVLTLLLDIATEGASKLFLLYLKYASTYHRYLQGLRQ